MDDLKQAILEYVIHEYLDDDDEEEVGFDTELISGGIVDSFSMVSLKRFLENKYDIAIPDADASPWRRCSTWSRSRPLCSRYASSAASA